MHQQGTKFQFSYTHPLSNEKLEDGTIEVTRTGLLVQCYGGENLYSLHYTPMQSGALSLVVVSQQCDSYAKSDIETFWLPNERVGGEGGDYSSRVSSRDNKAWRWWVSHLPEEIRQEVLRLTSLATAD
jgi:hypothetical protein